MTREEAIEVLEELWKYEHSGFSEKDIREALDMAIRALKNEQTDGDLISRQAVIDIVEFECGEWKGLAKTIVKGIEQLPSAEKTAEWIIKHKVTNSGSFWENICSNCGKESDSVYNYCPNCGAKMEKLGE